LPISAATPWPARANTRLELWGGHECTVNRVHDAWFDQTIRAGHQDRPQDLALFEQLGITRLRYPALWERISPESPDVQDFAWTDERLPEIRRLGMQPIVTLCHHGSGPHYTSLLDDSFAPGLARHAAAVAGRYPWIEDYTPVNEPLTTARFSALYGFWYPHHRDERAFWHALLNEIDATRLSMRAIRQINSAARLIQTDDLGYCHASSPLQAEADFQNERRWMGWDLLCGTVVPGHPLWARIAGFGLGDRLRRIADDPCPPDVIGINHYLSSERLLDHHVERHGGRGVADAGVHLSNGVAHVDVDAARSIPDQVIGLSGLIEQAWERYRLPIAVTECHNGSTRDEQARWFIEGWDTAEALRQRGVEVLALTAWSLLGSYDWNRMVRSTGGHYEAGVFDVRGGEPRPTLMARVLKDLAEGRRPAGPGVGERGWWHAERRVPTIKTVTAAPIAIIAGDPMLTDAAVAACTIRALPHVVLDTPSPARLAAERPWAIFDARMDRAATSAGMGGIPCRTGHHRRCGPDRRAGRFGCRGRPRVADRRCRTLVRPCRAASAGRGAGRPG
jgi:dTDP-4-dehydrorhamnose reductase